MQFPESWLREFCNPPLTTGQLAELLTMSGMEVESLTPVAPPFSKVIVAQVMSVECHPNADRLSVCAVDAGTSTPLTIVCGAPNVRAGMKVPCALVGALLPAAEEGGAPFEIKTGKLRGVESQGMLCSGRELKLSADHSGLLELPANAPLGRDVREQLQLDDMLFTLKLTPNLAHGLSVYGIAREVAALTGAPLKAPAAKSAASPVDVKHADMLPVTVEAGDLCGRFSGRIIRNVDTRAATPGWMVDRLQRCGQRSVTALVDISNYVMFESGQPSHIFDLDKIHGGLQVRWGRKGETLELLNGDTVEVDEAVGVIADERAVESLAGIMGGEATAVSDATRSIYVEAAFWWPEAVAGRSRRFNFTTDAGHRFERGVDPARTVDHIERISQLVIEICGGEAGPIDDQIVNMPKREPVRLRPSRAARVIGMPLTQAQCAGVMQRLALPFVEAPDLLTVTPPSWRFDLRIEEDLIEEVIRVLGYATLPDAPPIAAVTPRVESESRRSRHALRHAMAARDYQETINFSFVEPRWEHEFAVNADPIKVLNPIVSQQSVMRSSLVGSLVQVLRFNLARKASRVRVFELGSVYRRDAAAVEGERSVAGVVQTLRLGGLAWGPADSLQWGRKERTVDFFDVKGDVELLLSPRQARFVAASHPALHPGRCATVELDREAIGFVGELHPKWRQAYELPSAPVVFELDAAALQRHALPVYAPVARQQSAWRDLALIVGEDVRHDALMDAIAAGPQGLVRSARLFDVYKPAKATTATNDIDAGERSLAVRIELLDETATLTDERIDAEVARVVETLRARLGARLRA